MPITNSLAFLFTVLGEWWAEGKVISRGMNHFDSLPTLSFRLREERLRETVRSELIRRVQIPGLAWGWFWEELRSVYNRNHRDEESVVVKV